MKEYLINKTIKVSQWFKNGDHPNDYKNDFLYIKAQERKENNYEGEVVRYFRHPLIDGQSTCTECGHVFHNHGFIDITHGFKVCPGDWIASFKDEHGVEQYFPLKSNILAILVNDNTIIPSNPKYVSETEKITQQFITTITDKLSTLAKA